MRNFSKESQPEIYEVLSNEELIKLNQTRPYLPATRIEKGEIDILVKYTINKKAYLCFLNRSEKVKNITFHMNQLPEKLNEIEFPKEHQDTFDLYDVWEKTTLKTKDFLEVQVPNHGVRVFEVR